MAPSVGHLGPHLIHGSRVHNPTASRSVHRFCRTHAYPTDKHRQKHTHTHRPRYICSNRLHPRMRYGLITIQLLQKTSNKNCNHNSAVLMLTTLSDKKHSREHPVCKLSKRSKGLRVFCCLRPEALKTEVQRVDSRDAVLGKGLFNDFPIF